MSSVTNIKGERAQVRQLYAYIVNQPMGWYHDTDRYKSIAGYGYYFVNLHNQPRIQGFFKMRAVGVYSTKEVLVADIKAMLKWRLTDIVDFSGILQVELDSSIEVAEHYLLALLEMMRSDPNILVLSGSEFRDLCMAHYAQGGYHG